MLEQYSAFDCPPKEKYEKIEKVKIFIGCNIKSEYDEKRIKIKEKLNPYRIEHNSKFFYGCLFEPKEFFSKTIQKIKEFDSLDLYSYNKILKENNLSCDENFAYFSDGIYPIDGTHILNYVENFNYDMFFENIPEIPMHQRIKSINMFIFV
jgi:hypothetical protein